MSFLFVDRILAVEPGRSAHGCFTVPSQSTKWPPILLAEAIGQLAGWAAMAQNGFLRRPVAALAGEVVVSADAFAGDMVDLAVEIERIEHGGVLYRGVAASGGRELVRMSRCVGPLLPMEEFDDPDHVRAQFRELCGPGRARDDYQPVPAPQIDLLSQNDGESLRAALQVPAQAAFFADHFPRKAVFPATVLLGSKIGLAMELLPDRGSGWSVRRVTHVKISAFTFPGQRLEIQADRVARTDGVAAVQVTGSREGSRVSRLRVELARDEP